MYGDDVGICARGRGRGVGFFFGFGFRILSENETILFEHTKDHGMFGSILRPPTHGNLHLEVGLGI